MDRSPFTSPSVIVLAIGLLAASACSSTESEPPRSTPSPFDEPVSTATTNHAQAWFTQQADALPPTRSQPPSPSPCSVPAPPSPHYPLEGSWVDYSGIVSVIENASEGYRVTWVGSPFAAYPITQQALQNGVLSWTIQDAAIPGWYLQYQSVLTFPDLLLATLTDPFGTTMQLLQRAGPDIGPISLSTPAPPLPNGTSPAPTPDHLPPSSASSIAGWWRGTGFSITLIETQGSSCVVAFSGLYDNPDKVLDQAWNDGKLTWRIISPSTPDPILYETYAVFPGYLLVTYTTTAETGLELMELLEPPPTTLRAPTPQSLLP